MAKEPLEVVISATDDASKVVDQVADSAGRLEQSDPTVKVEADDNASDDLREVRSLAEDFDGRTAEAKLKVEQKAAKADIRRFERELATVDSTEAEAEVLADISRAESRLAAIDGELDKLDGRKVDAEVQVEVPDDVDDRGAALAGSFGGGFLKGLGAAGIATAIVSQIDRGAQRIKMRAIFAEQFGLVKGDAERLGSEASRLYAKGWGDTKQDVMEALGAVQQSLVTTGDVSTAETERIAEGALGIAEVFKVDVDQVVRSTGQLLKNGLAPDAQSAMDLVVEALQSGANRAGDFFETIDEYAQHFGAMGLSGKDMTDIISTGLQNGQRDADKLADAVKEMRLRTVDEAEAVSQAYSDLGLNADEYRSKIVAGGPAAREAFSQIIAALRSVENPVEQNRLAVELIGTQYEDLGPTALDALGAITDGTVIATGATQDLTKAVSDAEPEWDKMRRRADETLAILGEEGASRVNSFMGALSGEQIDVTAESLARMREQLIQFGATEAEVQMATAGLVTSTDTLAQSMIQQSIDAGLAQSSNEELAASHTTAARSAEEQQEAVSALYDQVQDLHSLNSVLVGGELAVEEAMIRASESAAEYDLALQGVNAEGQAVTLSESQMRLAHIDATESQVAAAEAATQYEIAQREAAGQTVTAADKNVILAAELRKVAGTLEPGNPLRSNLERYASELDAIPNQVDTALRATTDFDAVEAYSRLISGVPTLKQTTLRTIREEVYREQRFQADRFKPSSHTGSRFAAGETKQIRPDQLFTPDTPGRLSSPGESKRLMEAAAGGDTYHLTVNNNGRDVTSDDIGRALRKVRLSS